MIFKKYPFIDLLPVTLLCLAIAIRSLQARKKATSIPPLLLFFTFLATLLPACLRRLPDLSRQLPSLLLIVAFAASLELLFARWPANLLATGATRPDPLLTFVLALFPVTYTASALSTASSGYRYHEDVSFYVNLYHRVLYAHDYFSTVWGTNFFSHHLDLIQFIFVLPTTQFGLTGLFLLRGLLFSAGLFAFYRVLTLNHPMAHSEAGAGILCLGAAILYMTFLNQAYEEPLFYLTIPLALYFYVREDQYGLGAVLALSATIKETAFLLFLGLALDSWFRRRSASTRRTCTLALVLYTVMYMGFYWYTGVGHKIQDFYHPSLHETLSSLGPLVLEKALLVGLVLLALPAHLGAWPVALPAFCYLLLPIPGFSHPMSHHCTILWGLLLSNFALFARPDNLLDRIRIMACPFLAFVILAVAGSPAPFMSETREKEVAASKALIPDCATVVTSERLSPFFANRNSLLIPRYRSLWKPNIHDASCDTFILYDVDAPPQDLLSDLGLEVVPVELLSSPADRTSLRLVEISTSRFWAIVMGRQQRSAVAPVPRRCGVPAQG